MGKGYKKFNQKDAGETVCWYKLEATQQYYSWQKKFHIIQALDAPLKKNAH